MHISPRSGLVSRVSASELAVRICYSKEDWLAIPDKQPAKRNSTTTTPTTSPEGPPRTFVIYPPHPLPLPRFVEPSLNARIGAGPVHAAWPQSASSRHPVSLSPTAAASCLPPADAHPPTAPVRLSFRSTAVCLASCACRAGTSSPRGASLVGPLCARVLLCVCCGYVAVGRSGATASHVSSRPAGPLEPAAVLRREVRVAAGLGDVVDGDGVVFVQARSSVPPEAAATLFLPRVIRGSRAQCCS